MLDVTQNSVCNLLRVFTQETSHHAHLTSHKFKFCFISRTIGQTLFSPVSIIHTLFHSPLTSSSTITTNITFVVYKLQIHPTTKTYMLVYVCSYHHSSVTIRLIRTYFIAISRLIVIIIIILISPFTFSLFSFSMLYLIIPELVSYVKCMLSLLC